MLVGLFMHCPSADQDAIIAGTFEILILDSIGIPTVKLILASCRARHATGHRRSVRDQYRGLLGAEQGGRSAHVCAHRERCDGPGRSGRPCVLHLDVVSPPESGRGGLPVDRRCARVRVRGRCGLRVFRHGPGPRGAATRPSRFPQ